MDIIETVSYTHLNYTRRFKDTDLFEQIFSRILQECYKYRLIDPSEEMCIRDRNPDVQAVAALIMNLF